MKYARLDRQAIEASMKEIPDWALAEDGASISRRFQFKTFVSAFGFMSECALCAERLDHHPEWSNVYGRVDVLLTTHVAKGLTELDFKLARLMDGAAAHRI